MAPTHGHDRHMEAGMLSTTGDMEKTPFLDAENEEPQPAPSQPRGRGQGQACSVLRLVRYALAFFLCVTLGGMLLSASSGISMRCPGMHRTMAHSVEAVDDTPMGQTNSAFSEAVEGFFHSRLPQTVQDGTYQPEPLAPEDAHPERPLPTSMASLARRQDDGTSHSNSTSKTSTTTTTTTSPTPISTPSSTSTPPPSTTTTTTTSPFSTPSSSSSSSTSSTTTTPVTTTTTTKAPPQTSKPVEHTITSVLDNGGTTTITSTSWVNVPAPAATSATSTPRLQNAATRQQGDAKSFAALVGIAMGAILFA